MVNSLTVSIIKGKQLQVSIIKCKVEQSSERSSALPYTLGVVAIENWAFRLPSTMVTNFTF